MRTIRAKRPARSIALPLLASFLLSGCPREHSDAPPPSAAKLCESDAECNPLPRGDEALCGELFACVDSYCEAEPHRIVPCLTDDD